MIEKKHAQIARHAAIVLAGVASLSLTVVAGSYVVRQMADLDRVSGEPAVPPARAIEEPSGETAWVDTMLTGGHFELPAVSPRPARGLVATSPKPVDPQAFPAVAPLQRPASAPAPHRETVGANLRLGDAYVDAEVAGAGTGTVAITVGTNALDVLTGNQQTHPEPASGTRLRTEFDTRTGEVVLLLTDPSLGDHDLHLNRTPAPKPRPAPNRASPPNQASTPNQAPTPNQVPTPSQASTPEPTDSEPTLAV
ncbi:hypothetical protein DFR70_104716 [Nocardia tenerifensis]|uniref:Uncharacterized protein n=1 Tax=Nocardia tenerifensis TaxID=228006 RepID=A0A318K2Y9_9NOCA|nr:hypothetical protein [Nocardia tenerifensis]PXX65651.1 hypothetical protein DFR70_104716 [Nocardia tenerifensis]